MTSMSEKQKAIFYIVCSAFFFALMNMFVKMAGDLPAIQKSFFRNFVAFFMALFLKSAGVFRQIHIRHAGDFM